MTPLADHDDASTRSPYTAVSPSTGDTPFPQVHRGPPPVSGGSPSVEGVPAAAPSRDAQRARVYRAEDAWAARLDAARQGAVLATVAGSALALPAERRFGTLEAAGSYAAAVLALPQVRAVAGQVPAPALRPRRGVRAAHWEPPGTIALPVPVHGEPWALRESVLLHELAHHAGESTDLTAGHRAPYPALMLLLVEAALGAEAAFALQVHYGQERVQVGRL